MKKIDINKIKIKKYLNISLIILSIISCLINRYITSFSKKINLLILLILAITNILTIIEKQEKKLSKIMFSILSIITIIGVFSYTYLNPNWNVPVNRINNNYISEDFDKVLTYKEAKGDLDYMMTCIKDTHPAFYYNEVKEVTVSYNKALQNLKNMKAITVNDLLREAEKVVSVMNDGHTMVYANYKNYHVLGKGNDIKEGNYSLICINDKKLEDIFEDKKDLFSYETKEMGIANLKNYVWTIEDLYYLDYSLENGIKYTYEDNITHKTIDKIYHMNDFKDNCEDEQKKKEESNSLVNSTANENSFITYKIDKANDVCIMTLTECNYNDEYISKVKEMFEKVKDNNIKNVCVDLRKNGGGNSFVANEFIKYLDCDEYKIFASDVRLGLYMINNKPGKIKNNKISNLTFKGKVYVLTDVETFSSAMDFAMLIKDNNLGVIVGEASGNKPRSYGDVITFKTKNAKLLIQVSMKKWYRVDEENKEELIEPDIKCKPEKALDIAILDMKNNKSKKQKS